MSLQDQLLAKVKEAVHEKTGMDADQVLGQLSGLLGHGAATQNPAGHDPDAAIGTDGGKVTAEPDASDDQGGDDTDEAEQPDDTEADDSEAQESGTEEPAEDSDEAEDEAEGDTDEDTEKDDEDTDKDIK